MDDIKQTYRTGIAAQKGIDYQTTTLNAREGGENPPLPRNCKRYKQPRVRHCIAKRMWEGERDIATAKSGDRFSGKHGNSFPSGRRSCPLSASCSFCFCLFPNSSRASLKIQRVLESQAQKSKYPVRASIVKPIPIATDASSSMRHCRAIIRF